MRKRAGDVQITDDNRVVVQAGSAAEAAELAAANRDEVLKRQGTVAAHISRWQNWWSDVSETAGQPVFSLLAYVMAGVAIYFAWTSWGRITPQDEIMSFGLSMVGAAVVIGVKVSAGKWAIEYCQRDNGGVATFATLTIVGILLISIVGAAYQSAIEDDRQSGVIDANMQINDLNRKIRSSEREREDMRLDPDWSFQTEEDLVAELSRELSRPARNRNGEATGLPVGDHVELGEETYCVGTSYYVERYCPDLLELEKRLSIKTVYNEKIDQEAAWETERDALVEDRPEKTGTLSLAENLSSGMASFFVAGALLLFIDIFMAGFAWLANWIKYRDQRAGTVEEK